MPDNDVSAMQIRTSTSERCTGVVKWFNDRGDGFRTVNEGDSVEFTVKEGQKGLAAGDVMRRQAGE